VYGALKAMIGTPGSFQQELMQQTEEMKFIINNFVESECKLFKPRSSNRYMSVFLQQLTGNIAIVVNYNAIFIRCILTIGV